GSWGDSRRRRSSAASSSPAWRRCWEKKRPPWRPRSSHKHSSSEPFTSTPALSPSSTPPCSGSRTASSTRSRAATSCRSSWCMARGTRWRSTAPTARSPLHPGLVQLQVRPHHRRPAHHEIARVAALEVVAERVVALARAPRAFPRLVLRMHEREGHRAREVLVGRSEDRSAFRIAVRAHPHGDVDHAGVGNVRGLHLRDLAQHGDHPVGRIGRLVVGREAHVRGTHALLLVRRELVVASVGRHGPHERRARDVGPGLRDFLAHRELVRRERAGEAQEPRRDCTLRQSHARLRSENDTIDHRRGMRRQGGGNKKLRPSNMWDHAPMKRALIDRVARDWRLDEAAVAVALEATGARPGRDDWRRFLSRLALGAGVASLAAAAIMFIAANWQSLAVVGRFALAHAAIVACAGVAFWRPPPHAMGRAALALAIVVSGALLALYGQAYQTGADLYELFFAWAGLTVVFAIAAASG